jgi:hypothetical protein
MACTLPEPCYRQDCPHCYPENFMDKPDPVDPQSEDGWTPDTSQGFPAAAAWEIGRALAAADTATVTNRQTEGS